MPVLYPNETDRWAAQERLASELLSICSSLWLDASVELLLLQEPLHGLSCRQVLASHQHARELTGDPIRAEDSLAIARAIAQLGLGPARIDLGRLAMEWGREKEGYGSLGTFVGRKLGGLTGPVQGQHLRRDVVLFGFGRIGRLVARLLLAPSGTGRPLRLRAVVLRRCDADDLLKRADLLRYDSVHGPFAGTIEADTQNNALRINGQTVQFIESPTPEQADYARYGISDALVIDNSGAFRDRAGLSRHIMAQGAKQVLLTAPAKGDIPNIVAGINDALAAQPRCRIFAAASCTTNAIVPVLHIADTEFGIEKGHVETIHSYTSDQNLLDNYHRKYRRGRAAGLNLVITETGAGTAVAKVLPQLAGKLTGNAVRVPAPNVSLAILHLTLQRPASKEALNAALRQASLYGPCAAQLGYSISNELVSSDLVGDSHAGVVDSPTTRVSDDGKAAILYVWYDNEYGYAHQVLRLAAKISHACHPAYS